eukprot:153852-Prorocentrum_minimum.AAC.1
MYPLGHRLLWSYQYRSIHLRAYLEISFCRRRASERTDPHPLALHHYRGAVWDDSTEPVTATVTDCYRLLQTVTDCYSLG